MRKKSFSKNVVAILLSASFATAPALGAMLIPVSAFAWEQPVTSDNPKDGFVEYVSEYMANNYGTVDTNDSSIENNHGVIGADNQDSEVLNNFGTISQNSGLVYFNFGEVTNNFRRGYVANVGGTVVNNFEEAGVIGGRQYDVESSFDESEGTDSTVVNNIGGTVVNGYCSDDLLTINNYYYGDIVQGYTRAASGENEPNKGKIHIINDFSEEGIENNDFITVDKHYHYVDVKDAGNADIIYEGFTVGDYNKKHYAEISEGSEPVNITSTITIKAGDGYELIDDGLLEGDTGKLSYVLDKNDDGSYTVRITSLSGDAEISLKELHLDIIGA
ncbi:hypothetical protein D6853_14250 [Butyrivibrio sp. X503]|uniref:hypothetical protein n=1 Tax=Butyrivibrio sp. X503 TaxID=2364878 RepID=UPI000EA91449|nr:hypothetical protein [Butyrivibrio sp. X503]RKM54096.1 hypothetical protein D6853_14250 [Butyrivibrio sp. X503]